VWLSRREKGTLNPYLSHSPKTVLIESKFTTTLKKKLKDFFSESLPI
jgi:hypothetical protein